MICKLCGEEKPLIEAHIVPRCINKALLMPNVPMRRLSKDSNIFPARLHTGEYDKNILCKECDSSFSPWDEYARDLLFDDFETKNSLLKDGHGLNNKQLGYYSLPYDYAKLKLFILSMMWRTSISDRSSFRRVNLGPFEPEVRELLARKDPGDTQKFPAFICRYIDDLGKKIMLGAHRSRHLNMNIINLFLPGYVIVVKVDSRKVSIPIDGLVMQPDRPLIIGTRNLKASPEYNHLKEILETQA
jgi:hypothetical protein